MKKNTHPKSKLVKVTCSCGNVMESLSTVCSDFSVDVCSACHGFYTGTQKVSDTGGRIELFNRRFAGLKSKPTN